VVTLSDDHHTGYGECPSSHSWPQYGLDAAARLFAEACPRIESLDLADPTAFWEEVRPWLAAHPFALCALDEAAHDLWGRRHGQPVWRLWGLHDTNLPPSDYTIGLDTPERMAAKLREFPGWPIYKIKLGLGTDQDLAIVRELRRHTDARLRVDANTGWTVEHTLALAPALRDLGVEFIEQPLPRDDWEGMRRIRRECVLPVIADEACRDEADVDRCAESFQGVNIKLVKAGGLTPARRMIARARTLGLRVMAGCMCESSIGISAVAQLLPLLDDADLDGALLLAQDLADGVHVEQGRVTLPDRPGIGVRLFAP